MGRIDEDQAARAWLRVRERLDRLEVLLGGKHADAVDDRRRQLRDATGAAAFGCAAGLQQPQHQRRVEQLNRGAADGRRVGGSRREDNLKRPAVAERLDHVDSRLEVGGAKGVVDLVDDEVAHALQLQLVPLEGQLAHPPRRSDQQLWPILPNLLNLPGAVRAADDGGDAERAVLEQHVSDAVDLERQLARRAQHQRLRLLAAGLELLHQRQQERERLARAGARVKDGVATGGEGRERGALQRVGRGDVVRHQVGSDARQRDAQRGKVGTAGLGRSGVGVYLD
mmetsp:Transcript_39619/g.115658  ORF Transcript_39619/g.115658 Transcript_39619/m.115658 type:complete len:283 (+) Transcript_39619:253-1101(+)